ncbi:alpha/beta fold hydrolase [Methylocystis sp. IM3]|uniref:alpha/beta fold hydrolase n=1 Tax=unclassified Methylocystis TaxID=2625913 RepID=UPI0030F6A2AC
MGHAQALAAISENATNRWFRSFCQTQFAMTDIFRRAQGDALGVLGLNPSECPYSVTAAGVYWRLRNCGGNADSPPLLIVAAPIKRPYIWDIAPAVSAVRYCLEQGLQVYLLEWMPVSQLTANNGLQEYVQAILGCLEKIAEESRGSKPFLIGHSLGGTLAAISCAHASRSVRGLVLLSAPLCFQSGGDFRDALVTLIPSTQFEGESIAGSLLSHVTVLASPRSFIWARLKDAALSVTDPRLMKIHARVERWALDEVAVSGKLFTQLIEWLYRENRFCRGILDFGEGTVGPARLSAPTFAVANAEDEVAPPASIKPFIDALPTQDARLIVFPPEVGVCLQHVSILVGLQARKHPWPELISWLRCHS